MTDQERIAQLEEELAALKARLPKHSVPPAMIMELEDLEDELAALRAKVAGEGTCSGYV
jgi:ribosomal protein L29